MNKQASARSLAALATIAMACSQSVKSPDVPASSDVPAAAPPAAPPPAAPPPPAPPPAEVTLTVRIEGPGSVYLGPSELRGPTALNFPRGTRVALMPSPEVGYRLAGWSGPCSGESPCVLDLAESTTVTARFEPPPVMRNLSVALAGVGTGRVRSQPAGIDCPGTCEAAFAKDTKVVLSTEPAKGSAFQAWGYGSRCFGASGKCEIAMDIHWSVVAWFDAPLLSVPPRDPPAACRGLNPDVAPSRMYRVPLSYEPWCHSPALDGSGTLVTRVWHAWSHGSTGRDQLDFVRPDGSVAGSGESEGALFPQPTGFVSVTGPHFTPYWPLPLALQALDAEGRKLGELELSYGGELAGGADASGGLVFAGKLSDDPKEGLVRNLIRIDVDDPGGPRVSFKRPLDMARPIKTLGIEPGTARIVVIALDQGVLRGQWFDRGGAPLGTSFEVPMGRTVESTVWLPMATLIGGGIAIMDGPSGRWTTSVFSEEPFVRPLPSWLAARAGEVPSFGIVRGGRAYVVLRPETEEQQDCALHLEILLPDGTSCGVTDYPRWPGHKCAPGYPTIGPDGTVAFNGAAVEFNLSGISSTCSYYYWPGALR